MKLPEREFKVGDRVWSIQSGFGTVEAERSALGYPIRVGRFIYAECGRYSHYSIHRSLFTLEEAKELFGVEEEKPKQKVKRWLYWYMHKNDIRPRIITEYFRSDEEASLFFSGVFKFGRIEESMRELEE